MNASRQTRLLLVCVIALCSIASAQNTINVPADQPTIQQGIDAALNGDTVLVAPGTYFENINFKGKAIWVKSSAGPSSTTINGGHKASVVTFISGETRASIIEGFRITNGFNTSDGGGVTVKNSSPVIRNNVITANQGLTGIGIVVRFGSALIQGNVISQNQQGGGSGGMGGGIAVVGAGSTVILSNRITQNTMPNGADGGGIALFATGTVLVSGNTIADNSAYNRGGGIYLSNDSGSSFINNVVMNNSDGTGSPHMGQTSGAFFSDGGNTSYFINNSVLDPVFFMGKNVRTENNIFFSSGTIPSINCDTAYSPILSYNDIYNTNGILPTGLCSGLIGTSNNINADPLFLDAPNRDYHLTSRSPAIDAGDNSAPKIPTSDIETAPRISDGNGDGSALVDMGAYEAANPLVAATAAFTPATYTFLDQNLGTQSAFQPFILTNTGSVPAQLSQFVVNGDFAGTSSCPATLGVGGTCTVALSFHPTAPGSRAGGASFNGNFGGSPPQLALNGNGLGAAANFSPTSLTLADTYIGSTSGLQTSTLTNSGNQDLQISGISMSAGFQQTNDCPVTLSPETSCTFSVTFTPTIAGTITGTLTISSNVIGQVSLILAGKGLALPTVQLTPSSLDLGHVPLGSSATQRITLKVNGDGLVNLGSIGAGAGFTVAHNCGSTLLSGSTCNIDVTFSPTSLGAVLGSMQVTSSVGIQFATLSGFGSGAGLSTTLRSLDFGGWWLGYSTGTTYLNPFNFGDQPLTFTLSVTGDFLVDSSLCSSPIPPGAGCSAGIRFRPTVPGVRTGSISFVDNAADSPQVVTLKGVGLDYALSISPQDVTVHSGAAAMFTVSASDLGGNYGLQINLSCSTNAPASTCTLAQPFMGTGQTVLFVVSTTEMQGPKKGTPAGTYSIVINGTSSNNHSATASLVVKK